MARIKITSIIAFILVLFMAIPSISSSISHYYVTPHPNISCPAKPCLTLDQYVQDADHYFTSNTTFVFLVGEHKLSTHLALRGVTNITLMGNTSSFPQVISKVRCTRPVSIAFDAVLEIKVSALAFACCGVDTSNNGAIHLADAQKISFSDCILHDNAFTALSAHQSSLTLNNVTIANNSQSALKIYSSTVNSICSTFHNNSGDQGGAAEIFNSFVNFTGTTVFVSNSVRGSGGSLYLQGTIASFTGVNFFQDSHASGRGYWSWSQGQYIPAGGGILYATSSYLNFEGENCFLNSISAGDGGGIFATNHTIMNMDGKYNFINNTANEHGGGIVAFSHTTVNFIGNHSFMSNSARNGGAIQFDTDITVNFNGNYTFINNTASDNGGGIVVYKHTTVNFSGNYNFINNSASGDGGGIIAYNHAIINLNGNCNFISNSAGKGGGIYFENSTSVSLNGNHKFISNTASNSGGGIFAFNHTTVNIDRNCSFINNSASKHGGGILAHRHTTVSMDGNCSFINNSARYGGGIRFEENITVNFNGNYNFINNSAIGDGGGIFATIHTVVNTSGNCSFINNSAKFGGGISFLENVTVNLNGNCSFINNSASEHGGGIFATQFIIMNMDGNYSFINNLAIYGGGIQFANSTTVNLNGNCSFINNSASEEGGGIVASSNTVINMNRNCAFIHNLANNGGGILALSNTTVNLNGNYNFIDNSASGLGGGIFAFRHTTVNVNENSTFIHNSASGGGGIHVSFNATVNFNGNHIFMSNSAIVGGAIQSLDNSTVYFDGNYSFLNNLAEYGGGIFVLSYSIVNFNGNYRFINNSASVDGGAVWAGTSAVMNFDGSYSFIHNSAASSGGGIIAATTTMNFYGICAFTNNTATYGGGLALTNSVYYLFQPQGSRMYFTGNHAQRGGAINVFDSPYELVQYCSTPVIVKSVRICFFQVVIVTQYTSSTELNVSVTFTNNSAQEAGDDIYGGTIDACYLTLVQTVYANTTGKLMDTLAPNITKDKLSAISSDPVKVCICNNIDQPDCVGKISVTCYPGESFVVTAVAVGQRDGTVPAVIHSIFEKHSNASLRSDEILQNSGATCTTLNYTVFSDDSSEQMNLYTEGQCRPSLGQPLSIPIKLRPCPNGFELSPTTKACNCENRLQAYTERCDINRQTISRDGQSEFWVGYDNKMEGLILHPHCPFDYCKSVSVNFTLNNSDLQCNYNRSGLLCGSCQPGLSLVLGTSQCWKCSDTYLVLLIAFVLAGLFLVFFLLICRLTVAGGTINGLIFYANIVAVNRFIFIPDNLNPYGGFLKIFIAWINLDLGVETCFYNGMDAYAKTWLQFVFPFYIWTLVGLIIISSRYLPIVARTLGTNPVAVLATLFLLSYTKILRTIIAVFAFTNLQFPNDALTVWLYDGNITYLSGRHIPLFIAALAVFLVLFLPYTLLLLVGQFLQARSNWKILEWVNRPRTKSLLDAYHGPYRNKCRYWPGLLLLVRVILLLTFSSNTLHDPSVNLLAITVCILGLLMLELLISGIYKNWCLKALESFFILNLGIFAVATLYVRGTAGSQAAVAYTSLSAAFVVFIGIVIYHMYIQLRDIWRRRQRRRLRTLFADSDIAEADQEIQVPSPVELERVISDETRALVPTTFISAPKHDYERKSV